MIIPLAERLNDVADYYFARKLEEIRQMEAQGHKIISFGIGSPDLAPSERTIDKLIHSSQQPNHHGYQPYKGIPALREKIAQWYGNEYKVELHPGTEILPLMGSKEGILHISMAFLNPGDEVLVPNPGYPTYTSLTKLVGATIRYYDLKEKNGWYPDWEALEKTDLSRVKMLWVNYPHMPTGTPAKRAEFEKIVAFGQKHKILICHDNPYSLVLNSESPLSLLSIPGAKDVAVEFNSLSKSFNMAGWRIGMMVGKKEYVDAALRVKSNIDSGMFLPLQHAAIEALDNPALWHSERNDIYRKRRNLIYTMLEDMGCTFSKDQTGLFVWAKAPEGVTDVEQYIDDLLYKAHVFLTPGHIFGSNGQGYIRASLCVPEAKIKEGHQRVLNYLGK